MSKYNLKFILDRELKEDEAGEIYKAFPGAFVVYSNGQQIVELQLKSKTFKGAVSMGLTLLVNTILNIKVVKVDSRDIKDLEEINKSLSCN